MRRVSVTGTAAPFTVHPAEITILDDDSTRRGITLTVSPSRVREDAGATVLKVTASLNGMEPFKDDAEINLSLADGTATLAGGDYSAATGQVDHSRRTAIRLRRLHFHADQRRRC